MLRQWIWYHCDIFWPYTLSQCLKRWTRWWYCCRLPIFISFSLALSLFFSVSLFLSVCDNFSYINSSLLRFTFCYFADFILNRQFSLTDAFPCACRASNAIEHQTMFGVSLVSRKVVTTEEVSNQTEKKKKNSNFVAERNVIMVILLFNALSWETEEAIVHILNHSHA